RAGIPPAEIVRILHDEDLPVRFDQVFRMMTTTKKYENAFARFLENDDFIEAEKSIRGIDELYRKFKQAGDRAGVRFAFEAARAAKQNATELSQLPDLSAAQRREQAEVGQWFAVWLQAPDFSGEGARHRKAPAKSKNLFN